MESDLSLALRYVDGLDVDQEIKDKLKQWLKDVDRRAFITGRHNMIEQMAHMLSDYHLPYEIYIKEDK